jgi:hypothetical protein
MAVFDESEQESIRDIISIGPSGKADLASKLEGLNDAEGEACRDDITAWNKIKYGTVKVEKTSIKGTNYDIERDRLYITNRMRLRLGYDLIFGYAGSEDFTSITISLPSACSGRRGDEFSSC